MRGTQSGPRVVIVGAGHNGLVAAFYLARAGLDVQMLERRPFVGGACVTEELIPGYRFSTCANVAWALNPRVVRDTGLRERGLEIRLYDPMRYQPFPDGSVAWIWRDEGRTIEAIARISPADAAAWPRWQAFNEDLRRIFGPFRYGPAPRLADIARLLEDRPADAALLERLRTSTVDDIVDSFFSSWQMRTSVSTNGDLGSGGGSAMALAFSRMLSAPDPSSGETTDLGGFVLGGMGTITRMLAEAATEQGARIRTSAPVRAITVHAGRVSGVELEDGEVIEADIVLSNADPKATFLRLLSPEAVGPALRGRVERLVTGISSCKLHLVVDRPPLFAGAEPDDPLAPARGYTRLCDRRADYHDAWRATHAGQIAETPVLHVWVPSLHDPSLAPDGRHTVSVWIMPQPSRPSGTTWEVEGPRVAERAIDAIEIYAPGFRASIVDYRIITPADIEQRVGITDGNIHHLEDVPDQQFGDRPLPELAGYRAPIEGLYLCGAGQHPGGEVSGLPGYNAAHVVLAGLDVTA